MLRGISMYAGLPSQGWVHVSACAGCSAIAVTAHYFSCFQLLQSCGWQSFNFLFLHVTSECSSRFDSSFNLLQGPEQLAVLRCHTRKAAIVSLQYQKKPQIYFKMTATYFITSWCPRMQHSSLRLVVFRSLRMLHDLQAASH